MNKKLELKKVLEELMEAIKKHEDCLPYLSKLDGLKEGADPRLAHFLEKRSYEKALLYLKSEEAAQGSCKK